MSNREQFNRLRDLKFAIESEEFQEYFVRPIYKELDELKASYSCDSLKELYRLKGKKEGLDCFIYQLKVFNEEYKQMESEA